MCDPWVATRHVELLTNAGIDYLFFDTTNNDKNHGIFSEAAKNLFNVLLEFQKQGFNPPMVVFYTNAKSGATVDALYNEYYRLGNYESLWYKPNGKPMLIGITENNGGASDMLKFNQWTGVPFTDFIKPAMKEYFDIREAQWPQFQCDYNPNGFPWMSWRYPQWIHNGGVAVPVAQHSYTVTMMSSMHPECSRGYNNVTRQVEKDWTAGANFQTAWDAVFTREDSINDVHITGFNEWIAFKGANSEGKVEMCDAFNHEFSRDIEMMKGGSNDNFYLQMIQNVRKFKFVEGNNAPKPYITIATENDWQQVEAYRDFAGDAMPRNFPAAAGSHVYVDNSARNDITEIKVAHDVNNVYFMVKTLEDITQYNSTDVNWMNILINTGEGASFEGYQYIINRKPQSAGVTLVEKSTGGYNWNDNGNATYSIKDNMMQVTIPLSTLGLSPANCKFQFKVADHVTKYDDIMDYYVSGDSAPIGRLSFSYGY
jgi:hypothetical protein